MEEPAVRAPPPQLNFDDDEGLLLPPALPRMIPARAATPPRHRAPPPQLNFDDDEGLLLPPALPRMIPARAATPPRHRQQRPLTEPTTNPTILRLSRPKNQIAEKGEALRMARAQHGAQLLANKPKKFFDSTRLSDRVYYEGLSCGILKNIGTRVIWDREREKEVRRQGQHGELLHKLRSKL